MTKKIILDDKLKNEIILYANNTYLCTLLDLCLLFNLSRCSILNNIRADVLDKILFHGVKDSTKLKIRDANIGKKLSEETRRKKSASVKASLALLSKEDKQRAIEKSISTKIEKWGSWEAYTEYVKSKSKDTKLLRYGDENYNNLQKIKETKLERYGDENYNNLLKIAETQLERYGGYAFNDWDKVKKTNLERYGVEHNWSSPDHDGHLKRYELYGGKEEYYKHVMEKGRLTKLELYGDEFYSNSEKALLTMLEKYGYTSYMCTEEFRALTTSSETRLKAINTKRLNHTFTVSQPEIDCLNILRLYFDESDILTLYLDPRYYNVDSGHKFMCDFYIKSLDLFIELNYHPTHGLRPFNLSNVDDIALVEKLKSNQTQWNMTFLDVWVNRDPAKLSIAVTNNLRYITLYPLDDYHNIILYIREVCKDVNI